MRATIITTVTVLLLSIALLTYRLMPEERPESQPNPLALDVGVAPVGALRSESASPPMRDELRELTRVMLRLQEDSQEHSKQEKAERARLSEALADLGIRIRTLEGAANRTEAELAESQKDTDDSKSKTISEGNLGRWMDEALHARNVNRASTELAMEQAEKSLEKIPGVFLDDMSCGEAFCRASFSSNNGEHPAIQDLFGVPPFANEGFTINEPDGRVTLYSTQPGVSLEDLRGEAQQTAMFDHGR